MALNITAVLYMFFRLAPFMLVCFFSLYSIFNKNMNGIIYLAGLLIACFVTVLIGNFPGFQNFDKSTGLPSRMNESCRMIEFTETGPISYLPLGQTILAYTLGYVGVPIIKNEFLNNNFNHMNIPTMLFFFTLLLADFMWNMYKNCFGTGSLLISLLIGIVVGIMWAYTLMASGNNISLFKTGSTSKSCPKDTPPTKNRCRVRTTPYIYAINSDLNKPSWICTDSQGNLYISDTGNNIVRKVTFKNTDTDTQYIDTNSIIAGTMDLSTDATLQLNAPTGICFNPIQKCIFVADSGKHVVRKIGPNGDVTIYAGKLNNSGYSGNGNLATSAQLNNPTGLYVDKDGNLFIADTYNHVIRKIDNNGIITIFAGKPQLHDTPKDGVLSTDSCLNSPSGVGGDNNGNIYIADTGNSSVRKVDIQSGKISTFTSQDSKPINVTVDDNNNIYVICDNKTFHYFSNGSTTEITVTGVASMSNMCLDALSNSIYYVDNNVVKLSSITTTSNSTTFSTSSVIYDTNLPTNTNHNTVVLNSPQDMCIDAAGENIYIADTKNHVIRKVDSKGNISIFAGIFSTATTLPIDSPQTRENYLKNTTVQNGTFRTQTTFNSPQGICCDKQGNIYVADTSNNVIRKIDSQGNVFTDAGSYNESVTTLFRFTEPTSVGVDTNGILYVIASNYNGIDSTNKIIQINNGTTDIFASGTEDNFTKTNGTYNTTNVTVTNYVTATITPKSFETLKKIFISPTNDVYVTSTSYIYKISNNKVSIHKDYTSTNNTGTLRNVFIDNKNNTYITDGTLKIINTNNTKKYKVNTAQSNFDYNSVFTNTNDQLNTYGIMDSSKKTPNNTPSPNAIFNNIVSTCLDKKGNIYVLDAGNNILYKIYDNTNTV